MGAKWTISPAVRPAQSIVRQPLSPPRRPPSGGAYPRRRGAPRGGRSPGPWAPRRDPHARLDRSAALRKAAKLRLQDLRTGARRESISPARKGAARGRRRSRRSSPARTSRRNGTRPTARARHPGAAHLRDLHQILDVIDEAVAGEVSGRARRAVSGEVGGSSIEEEGEAADPPDLQLRPARRHKGEPARSRPTISRKRSGSAAGPIPPRRSASRRWPRPASMRRRRVPCRLYPQRRR